jgi:hypothetical protein
MTTMDKIKSKRYQLVDLIEQLVIAIKQGIISEIVLFPEIQGIMSCKIKQCGDDHGHPGVEIKIFVDMSNNRII